MAQIERLSLSLCHVGKQPNGVAKSTEAGVDCPCRSIRARMGESCHRRPEAGAIPA